MAFIVYPVTLTAGTNENVNDLNADFAAITAQTNGNLDSTNLSATAAIKESQLATGNLGLGTGAFKAYRNGAVGLATGAVVVFDTKPIDVSVWFDTSNGRYTPLVAGYYRLSWGVRSSGLLAADVWWVATVRKNGAADTLGQTYSSRNNIESNSIGTALVSANGSTDYFDVIIEHSAGGTPALKVGQPQTFFHGELIGRS